MQLSSSKDLVTLRVNAPPCVDDADRYLEALEQLAAWGGPFFLLADIGIAIDLSQEQRIRQNAWYKRSRTILEASCRALAIRRSGVTETSRRSFKALWRFPVVVTEDLSEAEDFLQRMARADREEE